MWPLRHLITITSTALLVTCLVYIVFPSSDDNLGAPTDPDPTQRRPLFSIRHPSSLFLPSAIITLTEENATSFPARPAAFGPQLPAHGLSGQVWVGNGFGDDHLNRRGISVSGEGELGCGDIPGWDDGEWQLVQSRAWAAREQLCGLPGIVPIPSTDPIRDRQSLSPTDDGTDDRVYDSAGYPALARRSLRTSDTGFTIKNADIQSLQESAEISGKVVLLSRGGCGFLEKVKWAQRRGASAVIIGDNVRGGALIRMYAKGDTSNITIPSVFTSHTTAHLLSSLIPANRNRGPYALTSTWDWPAKSKKTSLAENSKRAAPPSKGYKRTTHSNIPSKTARIYKLVHGSVARDSSARREAKNVERDDASGWLRAMWSLIAPYRVRVARIQHNYLDLPQGMSTGAVVVEDHSIIRSSQSAAEREDTSTERRGIAVNSGGDRNVDNIITPRSGVYDIEQHDTESSASPSPQAPLTATKPGGDFEAKRAWKRHLAWDQRGEDDETPIEQTNDILVDDVASVASQQHAVPEYHEGLWVTMTPADMDASPFLNTLFVLVVSPLITLAVVYSMLLLRSRLRRRRWRAPKSVVERLPVRIYRALSVHSNSPSNEVPPAVQCTSSTPLLQATAPINASPRSRPRSIAEASSSAPNSNRYGSLEPLSTEQEKAASGLAEWRRRYGGKQVECVVCLEEYVDGVSRVMSLPCGHEFHVDCM